MIMAVILFVVSPGVNADAAHEEDTIESLRIAAATTVSGIPNDADDHGAQEALEGRAYLSALALAGEADAEAEEPVIWEEVQDEKHPREAFLQRVLDRWHAVDERLNRSLVSLRLLATTGVTDADMDRALLAAHLAVRAEGDHALAGQLLGGSQDPKYSQTHQQRYLFLRPLATAIHNLDAADFLMDGMTGHGQPFDLVSLQAQLEEQGGAIPEEWRLDEHGVLHRFARHVQVYESLSDKELEQRQSYPDHVEIVGMVHELDDARSSWPGSTPSARGQVVSDDVHWWLGKLQDQEESHGPLLQVLRGYVLGAGYEGEFLASIAPQGEESASALPWTWIMAGGGAILAMTALSFGAYRIRTWRANAMSLLMASVLMLGLMTSLPLVVEAQSDGSGDQQFALTEPEHQGAGGNLWVDEQQNIEFTWSACVDPAQGCHDIWGRAYDPMKETWSEPGRLYDGDRNTTRPLIATGGQQTYLVWNDQVEEEDQHFRLSWCKVEDGLCRVPHVLSNTSSDAGHPAMDVDDDGVLHVVWQEEYGDHGRIVYKTLGNEGSREVLFPSEAPFQRRPAIDVTADGVAHLVWQESVGNSGFRTLQYATVPPEATGTVESEMLPIQGAHVSTHPSVAVRDDGTVGVVFNLYQDTYFQERTAGETNWSSPVNITKTNTRAGQGDPELMPTPGGWTAIWREGGASSMAIGVAQNKDGLWLQPRPLVHASSPVILTPSASFSEHSGLHVAWTGTQEDITAPSMYYHRATLTDPPPPPKINGVEPQPDAWVNDHDIQVQIQFGSSAPLDLDRSVVSVDGTDYTPYMRTANGVQILAADVSLQSQEVHLLQADIWDKEGGHTSTDWEISLDTEPTVLEVVWSVGGEVLENPDGWYQHPIGVDATTVQDDGSPVTLEISIDDGATYDELDQKFLDTWGAEGTPDAFVLPEDQSFPLRIRSMDAAGNGNATGATLGWDDTPPDIRLEAPQWAREDVQIAFNHSQADIGSPAYVTLQILDPTGAMTTEASIPVTEQNWTLTDLTEGVYEISALVEDEAGNVMAPAPRSIDLQIDQTPPIIDIDAQQLFIQDNLSGIDAVSIYGDGEEAVEERLEGRQEYELSLGALRQSTSPIELMVTDRVGNTWAGQVSESGLLPHRPEGNASADPALSETESNDRVWPDLSIPSIRIVGLSITLGIVAALRRSQT